MTNDKVLYIIRRHVANKHPSWSEKRVWACARWCYKKQNKMIRRKKND